MNEGPMCSCRGRAISLRRWLAGSSAIAALLFKISIGTAQTLPGAPSFSSTMFGECAFTGAFIKDDQGTYDLSVQGNEIIGQYYSLTTFITLQNVYSIRGTISPDKRTARATVSGSNGVEQLRWEVTLTALPDGSGLLTEGGIGYVGRLEKAVLKRIGAGSCQ